MTRVILRMSLVLVLAGSANSQPLAAGKLLVATAKSHDPDFARSVILLIHYDSESAIGLMLNKPTTVPISEILPEAKGKSDHCLCWRAGNHWRSRTGALQLPALFLRNLE